MCKLGDYKVIWRHFPVKKLTTCLVLDDIEKFVGSGIATCSKQDEFSKETGRKCSLTKALVNLGRPERALIWSDYNNMGRNPKW